MNNISETDSKIISNLCDLASKSHWKIQHIDEFGIQFIRPKKYSKYYLVLGCIFLLVFGFGILFWLYGICDYLYERDEVVYYSMIDIRKKTIDTYKLRW